MVIDRNDYGWYGSEYQSKCDRAPAVWLFPDIWKTEWEAEPGSWSEEGQIDNSVLLPAALARLQLLEFIKACDDHSLLLL